VRTATVPCRSAAEVESWLMHPDLEILGVSQTPAGIQGARVLTLRMPGPPPVVFRAKWRAQSTKTSKNDPRRELVAYAVQKLFLEPDEYVVPPTAAHCFPLDVYRRLVRANARASFRGVPCVLGYLSYWLENVQTIKEAGRAGWFDWDGDSLDDDLFEENPIYRDSVANMNLFTHVINHADTHSKQFLIRKNPQVPVVYSVDNSMAFDAKKNTKVRVDWAEIQVPSLTRRTVERLRDAATAIDRLGSVMDLKHNHRAGLLTPVPPRGKPSRTGLAWIEGRLVLGLSDFELDMLRDRVTNLLLRVDRGDIKLH
jgi:hypothetical protein